jgi:hypothetical protein
MGMWVFGMQQYKGTNPTTSNRPNYPPPPQPSQTIRPTTHPAALSKKAC